jgi:hypothetical protein
VSLKIVRNKKAKNYLSEGTYVEVVLTRYSKSELVRMSYALRNKIADCSHGNFLRNGKSSPVESNARWICLHVASRRGESDDDVVEWFRQQGYVEFRCLDTVLACHEGVESIVAAVFEPFVHRAVRVRKATVRGAGVFSVVPIAARAREGRATPRLAYGGAIKHAVILTSVPVTAGARGGHASIIISYAATTVRAIG